MAEEDSAMARAASATLAADSATEAFDDARFDDPPPVAGETSTMKLVNDGDSTLKSVDAGLLQRTFDSAGFGKIIVDSVRG